MTGWTSQELDAIEAADELEIASVGRDSALGKPTTIWVVRVGDDLFVRSVRGSAGGWFRGTQVRREGRISAGGVTKDVTFVDPDDDLDERIDDAYRSKYRRYPSNTVGSVLTEQARSTTLMLTPRSATGRGPARVPTPGVSR
jgi:hypothetical protein